MPNLEPTYLRYVYDSLNKGSLNAENAAALTQGFIGLYEQEFTQKTPSGERKKVLNQLALWALFKGPVSANMAAAVLELEEEQMKDLVDTCSSWFNSPESGKYQLYHERLRMYLLQKLKSEEIKLLNDKIITGVKKSLKRKTADDLQLYALQFLGYHQLIETALNKSFEDFFKTCLDNKFIDRQIDVSDDFDWSKEPIKEALKLAAFKEDKNIVFELLKSLVNLNTKEKEGLGDIQNILPIFSAAGMGKGALIANIIQELSGKDIKMPVLHHFCGSGIQNSLHATLYHFIIQGKKQQLWKTEDEEILRKLNRLPSKYPDLIMLFHRLLDECFTPSRNNTTGNLAIVLDGLDEAAVAYPQLNISDWFNNYDENGEVTDYWKSASNIKWIFTYREGFYRFPTNDENATIELVQPLVGLSAEAAKEALSIFNPSKEFLDEVVKRGAVGV